MFNSPLLLCCLICIHFLLLHYPALQPNLSVWIIWTWWDFCLPCLLSLSLSLSTIDTALSLLPGQAELSPWLSPVLVLPVLQLLSCSGLIEPLADQRTNSLNQDLAHSLLRSISRESEKPREVTLRLVLKPFLSCPPLEASWLLLFFEFSFVTLLHKCFSYCNPLWLWLDCDNQWVCRQRCIAQIK